MGFEIPSKVFEKQDCNNTLDKIKTTNRQLGQFLGKSSKASDHEKVRYESYRKTLVVYREKIEGLVEASKFVSTPKKNGSGFKKVTEVI